MPLYLVPFISQYIDIGHHEWRARGCGIASLSMVMAYWHSCDSRHPMPALDILLKRGQEIGAYREGIGWSHAGLVRLASEFGYEGYNVDGAPQSPTPKSVDESWAHVLDELERGPILASVYAGLNPQRGGGHIIVITGFENGLVSFNDPEERTQQEGLRNLALNVFLPAFKQRFIVIRPKKEVA